MIELGTKVFVRPLGTIGSEADRSDISGLQCYGTSALSTGCTVTDLEVLAEVMFTTRCSRPETLTCGLRSGASHAPLQKSYHQSCLIAAWPVSDALTCASFWSCGRVSAQASLLVPSCTAPLKQFWHLECIFDLFAAEARWLFVSQGQDGQAKAKTADLFEWFP